ncbi:response regulator [Bradyrhizobium rifense]|uniref:response regulator n=1 Tax=Bradyrhizobium rifense TaxID=515499 RepID=UPI001FE81FA2|nr:response regulator [Bradyrhizobium rifense]
MTDPVRILVVEDESAIQQFVQDALTEGGFAAELTGSGEDALSRFRHDRSKYRALLTDIGIGAGPNGWVLARKIREIDPDFPVVYMTGGHAEEWKSQGVPNSILVEKPFAPAQLVTAISQLLNTGSPSA